jgi:hypothetical protein
LILAIPIKNKYYRVVDGTRRKRTSVENDFSDDDEELNFSDNDIMTSSDDETFGRFDEEDEGEKVDEQDFGGLSSI